MYRQQHPWHLAPRERQNSKDSVDLGEVASGRSGSALVGDVVCLFVVLLVPFFVRLLHVKVLTSCMCCCAMTNKKKVPVGVHENTKLFPIHILLDILGECYHHFFIWADPADIGVCLSRPCLIHIGVYIRIINIYIYIDIYIFIYKYIKLIYKYI
jgi:hypothetical protein